MFYFILFVVRHYSLCVFVWILERSLEVEVVGTIPTIHTIPYHTILVGCSLLALLKKQHSHSLQRINNVI